jgi:hypothetical protein
MHDISGFFFSSHSAGTQKAGPARPARPRRFFDRWGWRSGEAEKRKSPIETRGPISRSNLSVQWSNLNLSVASRVVSRRVVQLQQLQQQQEPASFLAGASPLFSSPSVLFCRPRCHQVLLSNITGRLYVSQARCCCCCCCCCCQMLPRTQLAVDSRGGVDHKR